MGGCVTAQGPQASCRETTRAPGKPWRAGASCRETTSQPEGNAGELVAAGGALGLLLSYQPQADP